MLGSSPRAPKLLRLSIERHDFAITITCNSGIKLLPTPTYYVSVDSLACKAYADLAMEAQARGTKLVTLKRQRSALESRGVAHFDEFIDADAEPACVEGGYGPFRYSGPFCVELACNKGATRVVLVGMCGWTKAYDYFDDDHPVSPSRPSDDNWHRSMTKQWIEPTLNELCRAWPRVEFLCYGEPNYTVDAPNWTVIEPYTIRAR